MFATMAASWSGVHSLLVAKQGPAQCSGGRGSMGLGAEEKSGEKGKGKPVLAWPW